jgi:hypothetical protein
MKWRVLTILLLAVVAASPLSAANSRFNPNWQQGDTFSVQFNFLEHTKVAEPGASQDQPTTVTYTYRVTKIEDNGGRRLATIEATSDQDGWSSWVLTLDADKIVLLSVQEGGTTITYSNPFRSDAWMAKLDQYHLIIIQDFPKIPDQDKDEERLLDSRGASTPNFTQQITFSLDGSSVTATLSRTDPETLLLHEDTIVWEAGEKWWSSATMSLGNGMLVTGTLLPE